MRTLFILVMLGSLQAIRAQANSGSGNSTNTAGVVTQPRVFKPLKANADLCRRTVSNGEQPESSKAVAVSLSFDSKAQPFGAYDETVITSVKNCWCDLLDNPKYDGSSTGKVVLQFQLNYDGRISALKLAERTAGERLELLCQKAVLDPSPFPRWPKEMHKQMSGDFRTMTLTFHYLPDEAHYKK